MTIPVNKTLQENFKWRVELTPNNTAHKFLDRETTFKELDLLSNKVANGIVAEGCKYDDSLFRKKFRLFFRSSIGNY